MEEGIKKLRNVDILEPIYYVSQITFQKVVFHRSPK